MAIFEGPDRNKTIMIAVAVVVVAVIGILYAAGWVPKILRRHSPEFHRGRPAKIIEPRIAGLSVRSLVGG